MFPERVTPPPTSVQAERRAALRVLFAQGLTAAAVAALCGAGWGIAAARSAAFGGAIGMAGAALMAVALFRRGAQASALQAAWGFYLGQVLKVVLSLALLVAAFRAPGVVPAALLAGYAASFAGYWAAPREPRRKG